MKPLVSILIPAYNAEKWIGETLCSALGQTWPRKEIIVVDDGSTDRTATVAHTFATKGVKIVSTDNRGAAAARNYLLSLAHGDYIQWLDADDLLAPEKIERQLATVGTCEANRRLFSGPWAHFYHRIERARFISTRLWEDLSPVEWLVRKMGEHLHMQTATWLTSRDLVEKAGPWDTRLLSDDDGEYFCRVLLASSGTLFVREARVYYRTNLPSRLSFVGSSGVKQDALLLSMRLHVAHLLSIEYSERTRAACRAYLQTMAIDFYPERSDIFEELKDLAAQLGGHLQIPRFRWKYAWMKLILGSKAAKWAQVALPEVKSSWIARWDRMICEYERSKARVGRTTAELSVKPEIQGQAIRDRPVQSHK